MYVDTKFIQKYQLFNCISVENRNIRFTRMPREHIKRVSREQTVHSLT